MRRPAHPASGDWYESCLARLAKFERSVDLCGEVDRAVESWTEVCAAAGDAINGDEGLARADDAGYANASPLARWLLRRFG